MKPCLFFIVFGMLLTGSMRLHAQSGYVYQDSSLLYPEEKTVQDAAETITEAQEETNSNGYTGIDTLLFGNRHFLSADSFWVLKNEKQLLYAQKLDSILQQLKKLDNPATERKARKKENASPREEGDNSRPPTGTTGIENFFSIQGIQYILWGLAGLFVLFILYKLFFASASFKKEKVKNQVQGPVEEEILPVSLSGYDAAIAKAVQEKNYRLATRYLYLQLLQRLSAAGAIEFAADKTNAAYLRELTGKPYKDEVAALTMYYDYAWYGGFEIEGDVYSKIEARFKSIVI